MSGAAVPPGDVFAGIDIGGTKISVLLIGADGEILARASTAAPAQFGGEAMAQTAADLTHGLLAKHGGVLIAAGVGAAGVFDYDTGQITVASAMFVGWVGYPLRARLEVLLGVPVALENDVNAFLLGELAFDTQAPTDAFGIMLGTGVGGALVIDGELRRGERGGAGEIGHTPGYSTRVCTCRQQGHLETVASGTSIGLLYGERTGTIGLDSNQVADRARAGDPDAILVFEGTGRALAQACVTVATLLDVGNVIIGGGVSSAWDLFEPAMTEALRNSPPITGTPLRIRRARRGGDAVGLGVAAAAQRLSQLRYVARHSEGNSA